MKTDYSFELGPIRPPSEAASILLRVTCNCPWNRCVFCPVYKRKKFSHRSVEDVIKDIDAIAAIARLLTSAESIQEGDNHSTNANDIEKQIANIPHQYLQHVAFWMQCGMNSLFLQDADSLVIKTPNLVKILQHIREQIPTIERITTYARARTVGKKSLEDLIALREAGLNRIHIGMESGAEPVLQLLQKGVTPGEQVEAGRKAMAAGFELSEYFMPGCGGAEYTRENAIASAKVLDQINPTFIRLRTTRVLHRTPLEQMMQEKKWTPLTDIEKVAEIRLFIEHLDGIDSILKSDHIMNLIEECEGRFPQDKNKMLKTLDTFLEMDVSDQESFIIGRRFGYLRYLADYRPDAHLENLKERLKNKYKTIEEAIHQVAQNY